MMSWLHAVGPVVRQHVMEGARHGAMPLSQGQETKVREHSAGGPCFPLGHGTFSDLKTPRGLAS